MLDPHLVIAEMRTLLSEARYYVSRHANEDDALYLSEKIAAALGR